MAVAVVADDGTLSSPTTLERLWKDRINDAKNHRSKHEPTWHTNLAYAAGKHTLVWDRFSRQLVTDPDWEDRECYTADVITEQRAAALGELQSDDDRPELLLAQQGEQAEDIQAHINHAIGHAWEHEWDADAALLRMRRYVLDLGVAAIQAHFDPTRGRPITGSDGQPLALPIRDGQVVRDVEEAHAYMAEQHAAGQRPRMRQVKEGRHVWRALSSFNLLTPPGVHHEADFPWEVLVFPRTIDSLVEEFGEPARGLVEDGDIGSVLGTNAREEQVAAGGPPQAAPGKLRGHCWLYCCYERPSLKHPQGQVVYFASNQMRLLDVRDELPYQRCDGEYWSGIVYFHYWRRNDSFYSRAFTELLKDPQRIINRRQTQAIEIIDRGMPAMIVEEGALPEGRSGAPMEVIEVKQSTQVPPQFHGGVGPGEWMYRDKQELREDLAHASTLSAVRLGENPENVKTYSQLALLNENEQVKREPIMLEHKQQIGRLIEAGVQDIRRYWPSEKQILVGGDEGRVQAVAFMKSTIPDFYIVHVPKGSAKPRSQAAELKKVEDIANYSTAAGQPVPVHWLQASYDAGQALPLPEPPPDEQADVAELENHQMLDGADVPVVYYDLPGTHIPIHRRAQDQARMAGDPDAWERIEAHIQGHLEAARENAAELQAQQRQLPPEEPGAGVPAVPSGPPPSPLPPAAAQPVQ